MWSLHLKPDPNNYEIKHYLSTLGLKESGRDLNQELDPQASNLPSNVNSVNDRSAQKFETHRKPTLVLQFKSDFASKKITEAKRALDTRNEFNLLFRTSCKLIDIIRKQFKKSINQVHSNLKSEGTLNSVSNNSGRNKIYKLDECVDKYGCVYSLGCRDCAEIHGKPCIYVGETARSLNVRIKEHMKPLSTSVINSSDTCCSAVALHSNTVHGKQPSISSWEIKILDFSPRTQDRKVLEAAWIKKTNPNLNRDKGVQFLPGFNV